MKSENAVDLVGCGLRFSIVAWVVGVVEVCLKVRRRVVLRRVVVNLIDIGLIRLMRPVVVLDQEVDSDVLLEPAL